MNSEIKKLEQEIKDLKVKEKWEQLQKDLDNTKEKYLNKYYASHNFRYSRLKQYSCNTLSLLHIVKLYIGELYGNVIIENFEQFKNFYDKDSLYVICEGERKTISKSNTTQITISKIRDVAHRIVGFNREIDEKTYNNINTIISESIDLIFNTPIKNIHQFNYIESDQVKLLQQYGERLIDVSPEQVNSLKSHPFLYPGNKLLVNELSKQIIVDKIKKEREADALDVDRYFGVERIRRIGNHARILNNLVEVLDKINEVL